MLPGLKACCLRCNYMQCYSGKQIGGRNTYNGLWVFFLFLFYPDGLSLLSWQFSLVGLKAVLPEYQEM